MKISGIHVALHNNAVWLTGTANSVRIKYACGCVKIMPITKAVEYFSKKVRNSSQAERGTNAFILSQIRAGKDDIEVNEEM